MYVVKKGKLVADTLDLAFGNDFHYLIGLITVFKNLQCLVYLPIYIALKTKKYGAIKSRQVIDVVFTFLFYHF